jgi:hypothetical protein
MLRPQRKRPRVEVLVVSMLGERQINDAAGMQYVGPNDTPDEVKSTASVVLDLH